MAISWIPREAVPKRCWRGRNETKRALLLLPIIMQSMKITTWVRIKTPSLRTIFSIRSMGWRWGVFSRSRRWAVKRQREGKVHRCEFLPPSHMFSANSANWGVGQARQLFKGYVGNFIGTV